MGKETDRLILIELRTYKIKYILENEILLKNALEARRVGC